MSKLLPGRSRSRDVLRFVEPKYCVPSLFASFGYNIDNKVYTDSDLENLASSNNFTLVVTSSAGYSFVYNNGLPLAFLLSVDPLFTHASILTYYSGQALIPADHFDRANIALAARKTRQVVIVDGKRRIKWVKVKPLPSAAELDKQLDALNITEVKRGHGGSKKKKEVMTMVTRPRVLTRGVTAKVLNAVTSSSKPGRTLVKNVRPGRSGGRSLHLDNLLQMLVDPINIEMLPRYPDAEAKRVAIQKSFQNLTVNATAFPFTAANVATSYYLSVIHAGNIKSQMFVNTNGFNSGGLNFVLCSLVNQDQDYMVDSIEPGASVAEFPCQPNFATVASYSIPIHTAVAETYAGNTLISSNLWQPGECYSNAGTLLNFQSNSLPANLAFAMAATGNSVSGSASSVELITIDFCFTCTASATVTFNAQVSLNNGPITVVTLGSVTAVTNSTYTNGITVNTGSATNFVPIIGSTSFDKLHGFTFTCGSTNIQPVNFTKLVITVRASNGIVASDLSTNAIAQPFSRYNGFPLPNSATILSLTNQFRTTSSSLLVTDFTNEFNAGGILYAAQCYTGQFPAESLLGGLSGIGDFPNVFSGKEKKGLYSSPVKTTNTSSRSFINAERSWIANSPYTVMYATMPQPTAATTTVSFNARIQVCDIFELMVDQQQLWEVCSVPPNAALTNQLEFRKGILCENPFHLSAISDWIKKAARTVTPYLGAAASISGNKYLGAAAQVSGIIGDV